MIFLQVPFTSLVFGLPTLLLAGVVFLISGSFFGSEGSTATLGSSAVNGVYAASLYFGCDNVRADCDGGVSSDPGGARTAAERV